MTSETIEALHAVTSNIKAIQDQQKKYLHDAETNDVSPTLPLTPEEAKQIFEQRIAVQEAKLKELGWSKTTRVDSPANGDAK